MAQQLALIKLFFCLYGYDTSQKTCHKGNHVFPPSQLFNTCTVACCIFLAVNILKALSSTSISL